MTLQGTVYVVDDDAAMIASLTELIDVMGLAVRAYRSADQFLRQCDPDGPACLALDVKMPGMTGLELQDQLTAAGVAMPIIFLTGHADVPMAVEAMDAGAFEFLEKPVRPKELRQSILKAICIDGQRCS